MSVSGLSAAARRPAAAGRMGVATPVAVAALAAVTAAWTVAAAAARYGTLTLPSVPHASDVVLASLPVVLLAALAFVPAVRVPAAIAAAAWSVLVAGALELAPVVSDHTSLAYALPAAVAGAWLLDRRPALGVGIVVAVTASFGSLAAYLSWPYTRTVDFVLLALWLALVGRFVFAERARPTRWTAGIALLFVFLAITLAQVVLATDVHHALTAYEFTDWFILALPLVAFSQWERGSLRRIERFVVIAAALVGAYACLRLAIGPSSAERTLGAKSTFNLVDGNKLKLLGSFPNGADLGAWATLVMPFCLAYALGRRDRLRWVAALGVPLLAISMFGASLRAGAVAALFGALVVLLLFQVSAAFPVGRVGRGAVALAAIAAVGVGGYAVAGGQSASTHSFASILTFNSGDQSVSAHRYKWSQAFRDLGGHPFGYGVGSAPTGYTPKQASSTDGLANFSVDNGYLKIALEQGFSIMVVFAAALLALLAGLARRAATARDPETAMVAIGAAGTLTALIVLEGAGAFIDGLPAVAAWVIVGLGVARFQLSRRPRGGAVAVAGAAAPAQREPE